MIEQSNKNNPKRILFQNILLGILIIVVLIAGSYLRLVGVNWDDDQHMHPDERFLSLVQVSILPVESLSEYFNTAELNSESCQPWIHLFCLWDSTNFYHSLHW